MITVRLATGRGAEFSQSYSIEGYNDPNYFQPVFLVNPGISIPNQLVQGAPFKVDYPIKCIISLSAITEALDFDIMLVTDQG